MASRYIPPHLRHRPRDDVVDILTGSQDDSPAQSLTPRALSDLKISTADEHPLHTIHELNCHYGSTLEHSTLRDGSSRLGQLVFVVLFHRANPRWTADRIIFAHTNIHLLPGYKEFQQQSDQDGTMKNQSLGSEKVSTNAKIDDRNNEVRPDSAINTTTQEIIFNNQAVSAPLSTDSVTSGTQLGSVEALSTDLVPIFMELGRHMGPRKFAFQGYFRLARVNFLKPQSPELVRMLQQKWEPIQRNPNVPSSRRKERDPAAWTKSMKQEWAVLQFNTVPPDEVPEPPKIEVLPDEEQYSGPAMAKESANAPEVDKNDFKNGESTGKDSKG